MKSLYLILLLFLITIESIGQINSVDEDSEVCKDVTLSPDTQIVEFKKNEWKTNVKLKNNCKQSIYIATDPRRPNGSKGPYFTLNVFNPNIFEISYRVHTYIWTGFRYSESRGVILKKLESGEEYNYSLDLEFPVKETEPPYHGMPLKEKKIDPKMFNQIDIKIGYFFEDEGINKYLSLKHFGWLIMGAEKIPVGKNTNKTFLEIQNIISTSIFKETQNK